MELDLRRRNVMYRYAMMFSATEIRRSETYASSDECCNGIFERDIPMIKGISNENDASKHIT